MSDLDWSTDHVTWREGSASEIPRAMQPRVGDTFVKSDYKDLYQIVGAAGTQVWIRNQRSGAKKKLILQTVLNNFYFGKWHIVIFQDDGEITWRHDKDRSSRNRTAAELQPIYLNPYVKKGEMTR